jgi:LacI family transcriptional regulator
MGKATIRDVAKLAGVSVATVSRAVHGGDGMTAATRTRVLEAAEKLGFRPNSIAQSLKLQRSTTIGLLTDDLEGVFTMLMARGIEDEATGAGFGVFLCNSYGDLQRERLHLESLLAKQVDGVILLSGYRVRERSAPAVALLGVPVVYLYQYTSEIAVPAILPDDRGGGRIGIEHLVEVGRRRISFINGPSHYEATHARLDGVRSALADAGLKLEPGLIRWGDKWYEDVGYQLARELMGLSEPPDAIFCASDSLAFGAIAAMTELGIRIPEDVSIVGFDNRSRAAHVRPALSTVALPLYELGRRAAEVLLELMGGASVEPRREYLSCSLVERASSRPGASFDRNVAMTGDGLTNLTGEGREAP